jgi:hypothetical protein
VRRFDETSLIADEQSCTEQLARFFPGVAAVRLPVQVTALRGGTMRLRESSVVEFAGMGHAILISSLPLEFDDKVRLEGSRKADTADATVVAVQYHGGQKAVALKFLHGPNHWMMHS